MCGHRREGWTRPEKSASASATLEEKRMGTGMCLHCPTESSTERPIRSSVDETMRTACSFLIRSTRPPVSLDTHRALPANPLCSILYMLTTTLSACSWTLSRTSLRAAGSPLRMSLCLLMCFVATRYEILSLLHSYRRCAGGDACVRRTCYA